MAFWSDLVQWQAVAGEPVTWGESVLTPESRALAIRLPRGGLVWHRPVAVRVERGGEVERLPIHDVTRLAQLALLVASLIVLAATLVLGNRSQERNNGR